jgi:phosphatidylglycerol:prolipoprotein diacylglycerol transferase
VHPTQLYEALGCLVIAGLLYFGVARMKRFHGEVMLTFLVLYSALRFGLEFLRADDRGGLFGLSTSQLISVVIVAIVIPIYTRLYQQSRTSVDTTTPA